MNEGSGVEGMGDGSSLAGPHDEGAGTEGSDVGGRPPGSTGDARVDTILTLLQGLDDMPVADHAELYLEVHARLGGELDPTGGPRGTGTHGAA